MNPSPMKRYVAISGLVLALALISCLLFYYGRQHRVVIDNRTVEMPDGQSFRALPGARVGVEAASLEDAEAAPPAAAPPMLSFRFWPKPDQSLGQVVEMLPRERIMVKVIGPGFNLKANVLNNMGETEKSMDVDIHLGARRDAMVRLVKLAKDLPDTVEEFPNDSRPVPPADDEVPAVDGEGLPGGDEGAPGLGDM